MATYKKWTQAELQFINDNIGTSTDEEIAAKLSQMTGNNVTYGMIRRQRRKLGIVKQRGRPKKNNTSTITS